MANTSKICGGGHENGLARCRGAWIPPKQPQLLGQGRRAHALTGIFDDGAASGYLTANRHTFHGRLVQSVLPGLGQPKDWYTHAVCHDVWIVGSATRIRRMGRRSDLPSAPCDGSCVNASSRSRRVHIRMHLSQDGHGSMRPWIRQWGRGWHVA
jgi:hypothetical protein